MPASVTNEQRQTYTRFSETCHLRYEALTSVNTRQIVCRGTRCDLSAARKYLLVIERPAVDHTSWRCLCHQVASFMVVNWTTTPAESNPTTFGCHPNACTACLNKPNQNQQQRLSCQSFIHSVIILAPHTRKRAPDKALPRGRQLVSPVGAFVPRQGQGQGQGQAANAKQTME